MAANNEIGTIEPISEIGAIATSSMVIELSKGKTIEGALKITRQDEADAPKGLPPQKMHCSNLAGDGLQAVIKDCLTKHGREFIKLE